MKFCRGSYGCRGRSWTIWLLLSLVTSPWAFHFSIFASPPSFPSSSPTSVPICPFLPYFFLAFFSLPLLFLLSNSALNAVRLWSPNSNCSNFSANNFLADLRFIARDRVAWHFTTIPDGRCLSWTAEEVLFIFCPPGPEPLRNDSSISPSGMMRRGGRRSRRMVAYGRMMGWWGREKGAKARNFWGRRNAWRSLSIESTGGSQVKLRVTTALFDAIRSSSLTVCSRNKFKYPQSRARYACVVSARLGC